MKYLATQTRNSKPKFVSSKNYCKLSSQLPPICNFTFSKLQCFHHVTSYVEQLKSPEFAGGLSPDLDRVTCENHAFNREDNFEQRSRKHSQKQPVEAATQLRLVAVRCRGRDKDKLGCASQRDPTFGAARAAKQKAAQDVEVATAPSSRKYSSTKYI